MCQPAAGLGGGGGRAGAGIAAAWEKRAASGLAIPCSLLRNGGESNDRAFCAVRAAERLDAGICLAVVERDSVHGVRKPRQNLQRASHGRYHGTERADANIPARFQSRDAYLPDAQTLGNGFLCEISRATKTRKPQAGQSTSGDAFARISLHFFLGIR
jgi:hypothetical protein